MASIQFNIAKGRTVEMFYRVAGNDPANSAIVVVLLKTVEADATLQDYDTLAAILAGANVECDFTNYSRKVLTDSVITTPVPNDTNNTQSADIPDQTYTSAGGATNNTIVKMLVCYDSDTTSGTDTNIIPLVALDFTVNPTTDGNNLPIQINVSGVLVAS